MSIHQFEAAIDRFLDEDVPEQLLYLARIVSIAALNKVVLKSPVDRGRFRQGWFVTIAERTYDAPPASTEKRTKRGRGSRGTAAANTAITDGVAVIQRALPWQSIILQNNVEYGEILEAGGSKQAPRGMVAVTVAELEGLFR